MTDMEHFEGSRTDDPVMAPAATEDDVAGFGGSGGVANGNIHWTALGNGVGVNPSLAGGGAGVNPSSVYLAGGGAGVSPSATYLAGSGAGVNPSRA